MKPLVVGHLFPDYLNIYADRGNIAVLGRRAAWRGYQLEVRAPVEEPVEDHAVVFGIAFGQPRRFDGFAFSVSA